MTNEVKLPDREVLRSLFDQAVNELNLERGGILTTNYYTKVGDAVFEACYKALEDSINDTRRMHTIPAPAGAGKTSFAYAFIAAMTRYSEKHTDAPYGAVVVVQQILSADKAFTSLSKLLPGKVHIWTSEHDVNCKDPQKVPKPAARSQVDWLCKYPVIVVTNEFYLGTRGHKARNVSHHGHQSRALTIVDERPKETATPDIMLAQAQDVRSDLVEARPELKEHLDPLFLLMEKFNYEEPNKLFRPGIELDQTELSKNLAWFNSGEAERIVKSEARISGTAALFAFASGLSRGMGCINTTGKHSYFNCWSRRPIVDKTAGVVLLDATSDIDGVNIVAPWRQPVEIPQASYANLQIIHVPQHTKKRLRDYFKLKPNIRAYQKWMLEVIRDHMEPGETGLVVCKRALFDQLLIPNWDYDDDDERWNDRSAYTEKPGWMLDGRKLYATHWGSGVGSNDWKDATVVFLLDEFFAPRRAAAGETQAYRNHRADQGDLGSMSTLRSKARGVDALHNGCPLSNLRQMALRGSARFYDAHGVCGKQRVVIACDLQRLTDNVGRLFPGAPPFKTTNDISDRQSWRSKIMTILSQTDKDVITTKELSKVIKRPWRSVSRNIITPGFRESIKSQGWHYGGKGKLGARFERIKPDSTERASEGVLSPFII